LNWVVGGELGELLVELGGGGICELLNLVLVGGS
jgi:hypothetical protein